MPAVSKEEAEFLTAQKKLEQSGKPKGRAEDLKYYENQGKETKTEKDGSKSK